MDEGINKDIKFNKKRGAGYYLFLTLLITLLGGLSFAFISSAVSNTNNEKINAGTATLALVFEDNDNGISGQLNLEESIIKRFTIENTGTVDIYAKINWYNLVNTYGEQSLSWNLEQSTSASGTYESIAAGLVPTSSSAITTELKNGLLIPVNTTYYYKLTITLNNLENVDQTSDLTAHMSSFFTVEEGRLTAVSKILNLAGDANTSSTDVITAESIAGETCTNTLAYDGTTDNNLRYVGSNPCNYVTFNNEPAGWRIVGVMNNIDDGTGNTETRIKLVRRVSLGSYAWDSSESTINSGYGINDWSHADLKTELNGDYLNTTLTGTTSWYNGQNNKLQGVYDTTKGLNSSAQDLIGNAKWYLGGNNTNQLTASAFYTAERGTTVWGSSNGQTCGDAACPRESQWTGKVALLYPSDYGFAVGGSVRNTCLEKKLNTYSTDSCYTNDWISSSTDQWLLSPYSNSAYSAFSVYSNVISYGTTNTDAVFPVVYLTRDVLIKSGNGSSSKPYVIG